MKKKEMFEKLEELNLNKEDYMVVEDSSLVGYGVLKEVENITLSCTDDFYKKLDWEEKGDVKTFSCFVMNPRFYKKEHTEIKGFSFMRLEECLTLKKMDAHPNKSIIKKIELLLDLEDTYQYERNLRKQGYVYIGGVDEVGRGPLVGPVVAACCILPETFQLDGLTDSKKLSEAKREYFFEEIKRQAITYGIGIVNEKRIDEINIYEATKEAMMKAIDMCDPKPDYVLTDAMKLPIDIPFTPLIKGDLRSITISAASVLAKVTRDRMLYELDKKYPMYDFKNNVGYPTKKHLDAIEKYGIIPEHRRSYGPVKDFLLKSVNK